MLTEEQRQLAEDNHQLIYGFLHRHGLDVYEFYIYAAEGLCNAASIYDPSCGSFSALAYRCMDNMIKGVYGYNSSLKRRGKETREVSIEIIIKEHDKGAFRLCEVLEAPDFDWDAWIDAKERIRRIGEMPERDRTILLLAGAGYNNQEIGKHLGISRERVRLLRNRSVENLKGGRP